MLFFFFKAHLDFTHHFCVRSKSCYCLFSGLPKMQVIRNYAGTPPPALHEGPPLHIQAGDTVELLRGDAHSLFWQV